MSVRKGQFLSNKQILLAQIIFRFNNIIYLKNVPRNKKIKFLIFSYAICMIAIYINSITSKNSTQLLFYIHYIVEILSISPQQAS